MMRNATIAAVLMLTAGTAAAQSEWTLNLTTLDIAGHEMQHGIASVLDTGIDTAHADSGRVLTIESHTMNATLSVQVLEVRADDCGNGVYRFDVRTPASVYIEHDNTQAVFYVVEVGGAERFSIFVSADAIRVDRPVAGVARSVSIDGASVSIAALSQSYRLAIEDHVDMIGMAAVVDAVPLMHGSTVSLPAAVTLTLVAPRRDAQTVIGFRTNHNNGAGAGALWFSSSENAFSQNAFSQNAM